MTAVFELNPVLERDTLPIMITSTSELRLMNDARFPWCILIPRIHGLTEWHQLPPAVHGPVMAEIASVSEVLIAESLVTKLNVGALGNRVPQLHIHVVGRHPGDPAWPDPVWGYGVARPYAEGAASTLITRLRNGVQG